MPVSIDLDDQRIDCSDDEGEVHLADPDYAWLAKAMPGAIHCRPDGGDMGSWVKLGGAYIERASCFPSGAVILLMTFTGIARLTLLRGKYPGPRKAVIGSPYRK
ncbi:MAG: hypothetical protein AAGA08_20255 [Pseudomonadota bacterium]